MRLLFDVRLQNQQSLWSLIALIIFQNMQQSLDITNGGNNPIHLVITLILNLEQVGSFETHQLGTRLRNSKSNITYDRKWILRDVCNLSEEK